MDTTRKHRRRTPRRDLSDHVPLVLLGSYLALVIYSSVYPFHGWNFSGRDPFAFLYTPSSRSSRSDLIVNLVSYAPLGLLIVWNLSRRWVAGAVAAAVVVGATLSFSLESLQTFNSFRTASRIDLAMNTLGTLVGALLGAATHQVSSSERIRAWYSHWARPSRAAQAALAMVAVWIATQWSPFVPSFDVGSIRHALAPLYRDLHIWRPLRVAAAIANGFEIGAVCILLAEALHSARPRKWVAAAVVTATLAFKPLFFTRVLGLEHLLGLLIGLALLLVLANHGSARIAAALMLAIAYGLIELTPQGGVYYPFNWVPFAGEYVSALNGFQAILEQTWPFAAMCALAHISSRDHRRSVLTGLAGIAVVLYVMGLETMQLQIPGRHPDITNVILASAGWLITWLWCRTSRRRHHHHRHHSSRRRGAASPEAIVPSETSIPQ